MSAAMRFLSDQDEQDELARVLGENPSAAKLDAIASDYLRRIGEHDKDLARFDEAEKAEIEMVKRRYANSAQGVREDRARCIAAIEAIIARQDFGPRKSRKVAYGEYGTRTKPAHISIVDDQQCVNWALGMNTELGLLTTTYSVKQKDVSLWYARTGEIPPGCEFHPPQETIIARPE